MGITHNENNQSQVVHINISGQFIFSCHRDFRQAYESYPAGRAYDIDLSAVDYMDSSALGMLLMLKEYANVDASKIRLINASETIRKILDIASFGRLFTIV